MAIIASSKSANKFSFFSFAFTEDNSYLDFNFALSSKVLRGIFLWVLNKVTVGGVLIEECLDFCEVYGF